jgi:hypothetical protein
MSKRARLEEEDVNLELESLVLEESIAPIKKKRKSKKAARRKRTPTVKARLLKKLRTRQRLYKRKLSAIERDIRSLSPRKKRIQEE